MDVMLWVWVGVIALALIAEAISLDLTSIWFAVGGFCALILKLCSASLTAQIIVFVIVSALCILFLRRLTKRLIQKPTIATNIDKQIGLKTKLIDPISEDVLGSVKINGIVYSAKSENDKPIESGVEVEIVKVEGNKMIVKEASKEEVEKVEAKTEVDAETNDEKKVDADKKA